jgi:hypothetical protein
VLVADVADVDLAGVEFGLDFAGGLDHVLHLLVGDLSGQELDAAVRRDCQLLRRDDLEALLNVLLDILDGFDLGRMDVDDASARSFVNSCSVKTSSCS